MLIFLIGPPGAGKSRLAPLLAQALGLDAIDLDREVEQAAGRSVAEVFAREGEAGFRARERAALEAAVARGHAVVATGGGIAEAPANRLLMRGAGRVVLLGASPQTQHARLSGAAEQATRPMLAALPDLGGGLAALHAARMPGYRAAAQLELATDGREPERLVADLVALLAASPRLGR